MFLQISQNLQKKHQEWSLYVIKSQAHYLNLYWNKTPAQMFFCDFCEISKNIFFTEPLRVTTSGSSGRYLKTYQNDINWGNNSDLNGNTEHIFVSCDNFWSCHLE